MSDEFDSAVTYLSHYGYLQGNIRSAAIGAATVDERIKAALLRFQETAGLPPTGALDPVTQKKMSQPRCGCLDVSRDVAEWARWRKSSLTYHVEKRVGGLAAGVVDELIWLAWSDWMQHANFAIKVSNSSSDADIIISTGSGRADGFDGPSGTLAWAYLPNGNDGQLLCRFDLGETWRADSPQGGILFRNVACHEFGHLLGLEHSRVSSALMAPFYNPAVVSPRASDDIPRIIGLYGKATVPVPPPPDVPPNMIELAGPVSKGLIGSFVAGSDMPAGRYIVISEKDSTDWGDL